MKLYFIFINYKITTYNLDKQNIDILRINTVMSNHKDTFYWLFTFIQCVQFCSFKIWTKNEKTELWAFQKKKKNTVFAPHIKFFGCFDPSRLCNWKIYTFVTNFFPRGHGSWFAVLDLLLAIKTYISGITEHQNLDIFCTKLGLEYTIM